MRLSELFYELEPSCIAREPSELRLGRRGLNRMLCVYRKTGTLEDDHVASLPERLDAGDLLVLNNSRRSAGVLFGCTKEGGQVELRLVKRQFNGSFVARVFPNHFATPGASLRVGEFDVQIEEGPHGDHGLYTLSCGGSLTALLRAHGLPITSFFYDGYFELGHYNPIYATRDGSFESPMAGLHLSQETITNLKTKGVAVAHLTHHVVGSWLSPHTDEVEKLTLAEEEYTIPEETADMVRQAKAMGKRVVAVGSTCVRALESACDDRGLPRAGSALSDLCIRPGFAFRCVDAYLTSFHPARSSLMVLDVAFAGLPLIRAAYEHAGAQRYLFLEFGDAVLYL